MKKMPHVDNAHDLEFNVAWRLRALSTYGSLEMSWGGDLFLFGQNGIRDS